MTEIFRKCVGWTGALTLAAGMLISGYNILQAIAPKNQDESRLSKMVSSCEQTSYSLSKNLPDIVGANIELMYTANEAINSLDYITDSLRQDPNYIKYEKEVREKSQRRNTGIAGGIGLIVLGYSLLNGSGKRKEPSRLQ
jgi:hypothetical protein